MHRPVTVRPLPALPIALALVTLAWSGVSPAAPAAQRKAGRHHAVHAVQRHRGSPAAMAGARRYGTRDDVMRFADDIAARRDLDAASVRSMLADSRFIPSVARFIMPAAAVAPKNWSAYRTRFVEPRRIAAGLAFWQANEAWLTLAEERYGVPPEIVVGIVGVESIYGRQTGSFRVIDALATLSFDFPAGRSDRSAFFRAELESFFVWTMQEGIDPLAVRGSYAGAIGMPQFMPSSILAHAVDFDGDGHVDLQDDAADVIGSVARFLADAGWQRGMPTRFDVTEPEDSVERALLLAPDILPSFTPQEFAAHGAMLGDAAVGHPGKLALVELRNGDAAPSYVAGTANFYAVTRYNWSSDYAMAVIDLGAAIRAQRNSP